MSKKSIEKKVTKSPNPASMVPSTAKLCSLNKRSASDAIAIKQSELAGKEKEERSNDKDLDPKNEDETVTKEDETTFQKLPGYHGYLPREELDALLKVTGDYLLRISETEAEFQSIGRMKEIVLSMKCQVESKEDIRNIVIRKKKDKTFYVNPKKSFPSVSEFIDFHKKKELVIMAGKIKVSQLLKNPIPLTQWEFVHKDVKLSGKELGTGEFGVVQLGELNRRNKWIPVAIKSTKGVVNVSKEKVKDLMKEARLVRTFKHKNVVRTYGCAVDEQPLYILLEFVDGGSLKKFLKEKKDTITPDDRLSMTLGAARGLDYLHRQSVVHCDVAARNCLVTTKKLVKIADFGLSITLKASEVRCRDGEKIKLASKWLAPESLSYMKFSHKSDIYSFGNLTYEIYAGEEPYHDVARDKAKELIAQAKAPAIPKPFPNSLQIYWKEKIFAVKLEDRPIMTEVIIQLTKAGAKDVDE